MPSNREKKNLKLVLLFCILFTIFLLNHIEYYYRTKSIQEKRKIKSSIVVQTERSIQGHNTIGIDENALGKSEKQFLRFSTLGTWNFDLNEKNSCPKEIQKLHGRNIMCIGFMYPLESGQKIKLFCLLRNTQTCCYGPKPQYNQYIFVEMKKAIKFERQKPVILEGRFFVDPKPDEGYIYRLEGKSVQAIDDEIPDINASQAAINAGFPLFDFSLLQSFKNRKQKNTSILNSKLQSMEGKNIVLEGFLVGMQKERNKVIVGKYWWDGISQGKTPNIYNAVMVLVKNKNEMPPVWKQKVVFTGKLHITHNPSFYSQKGIIYLQNAQRGVPGAQNISEVSPILSIFSEIILLCISAIWAFKIFRANDL